MGHVVKRDTEVADPPRPKPEPADYSDEVSEEQLKRIRELVRQDIEDEEFEVVDVAGVPSLGACFLLVQSCAQDSTLAGDLAMAP